MILELCCCLLVLCDAECDLLAIAKFLVNDVLLMCLII